MVRSTLLRNIGQVWMWLTVTDALAYNSALKCFIGYVIDAPQSGLKGFSQTLNKLLRCATTPRCATLE
jgi:hypothetical protein